MKFLVGFFIPSVLAIAVLTGIVYAIWTFLTVDVTVES